MKYIYLKYITFSARESWHKYFDDPLYLLRLQPMNISPSNDTKRGHYIHYDRSMNTEGMKKFPVQLCPLVESYEK